MNAIAILSLTVTYVAIHALLSILVLKDAEKRGIDNSVLWASVVAVFTGIGLVLYLLRRTMPEGDAEASEDTREGGAFSLPGSKRSNEPSRTDE